MTISSYALVDGIPGPAVGSGLEDHIECYEFSYRIELPTDIRDGSVTGRRQHGFFSITKELDKASPLFAKHLCDNIEVAKVEVKHYRPNMQGDIEHYFTHEMKKVKVVGVSTWKPNTCDDASKRFRDMEQVRFMFEEITIKDSEGNEYTDKWAVE